MLRGASGPRLLVAAMALAAVVPDLDNLAALGSPELHLIHHRGVTHSLCGGMLIALVLGAAFRFSFRFLSTGRWSLLAGAAVGGHIFLDCASSCGTRVLLPFSDRLYSAGCVYVVDPLFSLGLAVFFLTSLRPERRRAAALLGLALLALYPVASLGIRHLLGAGLERRLARQGERAGRLELSPDAFAPFFWKLIIDDGPSLRMAPVALLDPTSPLDFRVFRKADADLLAALGDQASMFRAWARFAAWPVMEEGPAGSGRVVRFDDLRFRHAVPFGGERLRREGKAPFRISALLDASGNLADWEYDGRGGAPPGRR